MKKSFSKVFVFIVFFMVFAQATTGYAEEGEKSLTIMATSSLTEALTEVTREYAEKSNMTINVYYGSPSDLTNRIKDGEISDVFIGEKNEWTAELKQQGLIDVYSTKDLFRNSLVIASGNENVMAKRSESLAQPEQILKGINERAIMVIADSDNDPLGIFTKKFLEKSGYWHKIQPMSLRANNSVNASHLIATGQMVGVIYLSDALSSSGIKILSSINEDEENPIIYQASVVASNNMAVAREFIEYLAKTEALKSFQNYGFKAL